MDNSVFVYNEVQNALQTNFSVLFLSQYHMYLCDANEKEEWLWKDHVSPLTLKKRQDDRLSPGKISTLIFIWLKTLYSHCFYRYEPPPHTVHLLLSFCFILLFYTYFIHVLPVCLRYTLRIINRQY